MIVTLAAALYLGLLTVQTGLALRYARRLPRPSATAVDAQRGVTVLQPILGGDPLLAAALAANLRALPAARFVWLVDDDDPLGRAAARTAAEDAAAADRIDTRVCAPPPAGVNPKLYKLELAWRDVRTDSVVVLDDDTRLPAATLALLVDALDDAALATALPYYHTPSDRPSALLAQFVNNNAAITYLPPLNLIEPLTLNGMCYALRRAALDGIGGFAPLARHLADDLALAERVAAYGGRIRQLAAPVEVATRLADGAAYWRQMHRWFVFATLLLRRQSVVMNAVIGLCYGLPPLLLWALFAAALLAPPGAALTLLLTLSARAALLAALQRALTGRVGYRPLLSELSALLQPVHLVHALCVRTIRWRSRRYRVLADGRFEPS